MIRMCNVVQDLGHAILHPLRVSSAVVLKQKTAINKSANQAATAMLT